jgi:abhydrolase domain-containing protein 14
MTSGTEGFLNVRELRIRYWSYKLDRESISEGSRPPVVLFHGYSFSIDDWKRIGTLSLLTKNNYPVLALDLPSGKASRSDKSEFSDENEYSRFIEETFRKIGLIEGDITKSFVLVGPSMGGGLAISYALHRPKDILGLILISPALKVTQDRELSSLDIPTLLIWGEKDDVFPVEEYAQPLKAKLAHSKFVILKNAGHAAYLDKPDEFHDILLDFLEEIT